MAEVFRVRRAGSFATSLPPTELAFAHAQNAKMASGTAQAAIAGAIAGLGALYANGGDLKFPHFCRCCVLDIE